jgi:hypothetical protein
MMTGVDVYTRDVPPVMPAQSVAADLVGWRFEMQRR